MVGGGVVEAGWEGVWGGLLAEEGVGAVFALCWAAAFALCWCGFRVVLGRRFGLCWVAGLWFRLGGGSVCAILAGILYGSCYIILSWSPSFALGWCSFIFVRVASRLWRECRVKRSDLV